MVLLSLIENRCHPLVSKKQKQGTEMCQDPACSLSCPLGMTAEWLCITAESHAGAADCRVNSFLSCRLSLTAESKKNGRLYKGLLFPCSVSHCVCILCNQPPTESNAPHHPFLFRICPHLTLYLYSFSKTAKPCGFISCPSAQIGWCLSFEVC